MLGAALWAGSYQLVSAAILSVPGSYPTIQSAINASAPLDVVEVAAGIYTENISFGGKNISVIGVAGAGATILQSPSTSSTVVSMNGERRRRCCRDLRFAAEMSAFIRQ